VAQATGIEASSPLGAATPPATFGDHLGGRLAVAEPQTGFDASAEILTRVVFESGNLTLPTTTEKDLAGAVARAEAANGRLLITGGGAGADVQASRAEVVALALQRLGARPEMLELAPGAPENEVRVSLLRPNA
jgi:hypothetical protein